MCGKKCYVSILTWSGFIGQQQAVLSSLQSLTIFFLYLKGLYETNRLLAFQKKKRQNTPYEKQLCLKL